MVRSISVQVNLGSEGSESNRKEELRFAVGGNSSEQCKLGFANCSFDSTGISMSGSLCK